jgi:hypothetical protein
VNEFLARRQQICPHVLIVLQVMVSERLQEPLKPLVEKARLMTYRRLLAAKADGLVGSSFRPPPAPIWIHENCYP